MLTRESLHVLILGLADQVTLAETNRLLYKRLTELCGEGKEFEFVYRTNHVFWELMCHNMRDEIIGNLARLYDEQPDSFGLRRLIEKCEKNLSLFPNKCQSIRFDDYGEPKYVCPQQVITELWQTYNRVNDERLTLKKIRNKSFSHIERKFLVNKTAAYDDFYWKDVEELISAAEDIILIVLAGIYDEALVFELMDYDDIDGLIKIAMYGYEKKEEEYTSLSLSTAEFSS